MLKNEIQSLQKSGDVREGTVLYNELSALHKKLENAGLESQKIVQAVFGIVNQQLAKVKQETAFVLVKLIEQSSEHKAMIETIEKMVAEPKLMRGKMDTVQKWQNKKWTEICWDACWLYWLQNQKWRYWVIAGRLAKSRDFDPHFHLWTNSFLHWIDDSYYSKGKT